MQKKTDPDINLDELQLLFNILIRLPVTKEVKLEVTHLDSKVMHFAFKYNLEITNEKLWT